jgi:hypothetical protein
MLLFKCLILAANVSRSVALASNVDVQVSNADSKIPINNTHF